MVRDGEDLRAQIGAALQKYAKVEARLSHAGGPPALGDLYAFAETAAEGIEWALVLQNLDDPDLWFAVPFDQYPQVGTWDVEVSELTDAGPGTLRCGRGIWVPVDDLETSDRSGFLEPTDVRAAQERLAAMVEGTAVEPRWHVDDDPDYEEWLGEVELASDRLEQYFRAAVRTLSIKDITTDWTLAAGVRLNRPVSLAADSEGLGAAPKEPILPLPGAVLASDLPGTLAVVRDEEGLRLLYYATAPEETPPPIRVRQGEFGRVAEWSPLPRNVYESREIWDPHVSLMVRDDKAFRCILTPE